MRRRGGREGGRVGEKEGRGESIHTLMLLVWSQLPLAPGRTAPLAI